MEPEQAGAVESPGALLSNRSVPGLHGLHGLFSGRKSRVTPTRRERVEQERPLFLSLACFLPSPYPPATKPAPNKRGPMAPHWGLAD